MRTRSFQPLEILVDGMTAWSRELGLPAPVFNIARVTDDDPFIRYKEPEPNVWALDNVMNGRHRRQMLPTLRDLEKFARAWDEDPREILAAAINHPRSPFGLEARGGGSAWLAHRGIVTKQSLRSGL